MELRRLTLLFLLLALVTGCWGEPPVEGGPDELTIAAASSLRPIVDQLVEEWNRTNPSVPARASYGASGLLYAQIGSEAPFDLFLSADDVYPRRLHDRGLADEPFQFATGRLAVWLPESVDPIQKVEDLTAPRFSKIAIASPNLAPYGEAALEALDGAGVYDQIKGRLLFGGNVMEAAHYAESGGATAAIISLSLVKGTSLSSRGTYLIVPSDLHYPIRHEAAIITASPDRRYAKEFSDLLRGERGRELLAANGLETAEEDTGEPGE